MPMIVAASAKTRALLAVLVSIVFLAPYSVGVFYSLSWFTGLYFLLGLVIIWYVVAANHYSRSAVRVGLLIISSCIAVTAIDLMSRSLLVRTLYYRPHEMFFINPWPPVPSLARYARNVFYEGEAFGDLAAVSGMAEHRERRHVVFRTDPFGFRNDTTARDKVIDIIILGDSFGVGNGTSQEKTWAAILSDRYGFRTYNLSLPGGPWQEVMNLKMELPRLKTHRRSVALWVIFTGNDLHDDVFHEGMRRPEMGNGVQQVRVGLSNFRRRSPVRELWRRAKRQDRVLARSAVVARDFENGRKILFWGPYADRRNSSIEEIVRHPNYGKLRMVFDEMRAFAETEGLTVGIVSAPPKAEVYSWVLDGERRWSADPKPSGVSVAVREMSQVNGFEFLELKPSLIEESKRVFEARGELLWWYDDTHWNETGHEVVSTIIHRYLLARMKMGRM